MSEPSSQLIASWARDEIERTDWVPLEEVMLAAVMKVMRGRSSDSCADLVEKNILHVAEHLRNELAQLREDGSIEFYEIDDESPPYVRLTSDRHPTLVRKLRAIDPFKFEEVCCWILKAIGADAEATQRTNDGGVDFWAIDLDFVPDGFTTPLSSRAGVIGQAKRYKDGHTVGETEIRRFIGGGLKWRHELLLQKKLQPLSPVIYAFWTTSNFDVNARAYAKAMGVWFMDGVTLANYCARLGLEPRVMELPNAITLGNRTSADL